VKRITVQAGPGTKARPYIKNNQSILGIWWLPPAIPATQEAEVRRIEVHSQPGKTAGETLSRKNPSQNRAGGVAQDECPEFKFQYSNK
jgi:hypothetical protein